VPVILAVASSQGVTGRDAGPTGSRLGMVGQWIPRVMKVATENVSPYLGNPALSLKFRTFCEVTLGACEKVLEKRRRSDNTRSAKTTRGGTPWRNKL